MDHVGCFVFYFFTFFHVCVLFSNFHIFLNLIKTFICSIRFSEIMFLKCASGYIFQVGIILGKGPIQKLIILMELWKIYIFFWILLSPWNKFCLIQDFLCGKLNFINLLINFPSCQWCCSLTVYARLTVRSFLHQHEQKFSSAQVCRVAFKHLPNPSEVIPEVSEP